MKQVSQHNKTGEVRVENVPPPALKPGHVLVQTKSSLISAGTEKASISIRKSSLLQKAKRQPDQVKKVLEQIRQYGILPTYRRVRALLDSTTPIGYSVAGVVVAVGDDLHDLKPGDRVACAGNTSNHAEWIVVPRNLCAKIPRDVEFEEAAYTTLGAIALQGVRQAEARLGETIAVIGLGLVGQLTVQLLKANGCAVVGIDLDPSMVNLARESGATLALRRDKDDIQSMVLSLTKGIGVDSVIITAATSSSDPVALAGDLCRDKGRVVLVGDVAIELPRPPYYMKELEFRLSRSLGPGRYDPTYEESGVDYPVGFVRWTENRNMQEFLRLLSEKKINVTRLTSHRFPINDAAKAYKVIAGVTKGDRPVGVLLEYPATEVGDHDLPKTKVEIRPGEMKPSALNVGFLGAGNFAQGFLIPNVKRISGATLVGVCTGYGLNAMNVARNHQFRFATTDPKEILENSSISTVFVASRHHLHARYAVEVLQSGKHVFVEKPLALTPNELNEIVSTYSAVTGGKSRKSSKGKGESAAAPLLMVGYNRRFAPHIAQVKRFFEQLVGPFVINYRVSAGLLPSSHWTKDPVEGGGRILGEICHFVDLIQFLTSSTPVKVFAEPISSTAGSPDDDSVAITMKMQNGSLGTITYVASGDTSLPKEYIEIYSTGKTAVLENFQRLTLYQQGKRREFKRSTIDKGHRDEVAAFLNAVRGGTPAPIPFESLVTTSLVTFKIVESLKVGVPVSI